MAIKGKKRARSRPRVVATAPRPFLVPPRTPLMRRKSTQAVLLLVLFAVIAAAAFGYRAYRDDREAAAAVEDLEGRVETAIVGNEAGQKVGGNFLILPEMGQALGGILSGQAPPGQLAGQTARWQKAATRAAEDLAVIETEVPELQQARQRMEQGLEVYAGIAANLGVALELQADTQSQLLKNLGEQFAVAADIFDRGWALVLVERHRAGLPDPQTFDPNMFPGGGVPGGFPGGG